MHLPLDQVCEFKARHQMLRPTASLTSYSAISSVRNQHTCLCNTGIKGSKAGCISNIVALIASPTPYRNILASEVAKGCCRARYTWGQHSTPYKVWSLLPWSYLPQRTGSHHKPDTASTQTLGEDPSPSHTPKRTHARFTRTMLKNTPLPPTPSLQWHRFVSEAEHLTNLLSPGDGSSLRSQSH